MLFGSSDIFQTNLIKEYNQSILLDFSM